MRILAKRGTVRAFLSDVVMRDVNKLGESRTQIGANVSENEHLLFRGNSLATKAMEAYQKLVGEQYLQWLLRDIVRQIVDDAEDCEVSA